jgi:glucose-6-phosphate 1-epimerase
LESVAASGDAVVVSMATASDEDTRKWWPNDYRLVHRATFGSELKLELEVTNTGTSPLRFEEALHTYHRIGSVDRIRIEGLDGVTYLDKTDGYREKTQQGDIAIAAQTDRVYMNTRHPIEVIDPEMHRRIHIVKSDSLTTVVWNPWREGALSLPDMGAGEWPQMVCVEASNVREFAITLEPGQQHTLTVEICVSAV